MSDSQRRISLSGGSDIKNIAFYIPLLNIGGAERVVIDVLTGLSGNAGLNLFLITDTRNSKLLEQLPQTVHQVHLPDKRFASRLMFLFNYAYKLYRLHKIADSLGLDVMVSHLTHANIRMLLCRLLFGPRKMRVIAVEHNVLDHKDAPWVRRILMRMLVGLLYSRCDRVIAVSNEVKNNLVRDFGLAPSKCTVIYDPIDTIKINRLKDSAVEGADWAAAGKNRKIIMVGRLELQKNHLLALQAMEILIKQDPHIVLLIVGDGSLRNTLQDRVTCLGLEHNVVLLGAQKNPYKFMNLANVLLLTSAWEGFGIVLAEAMLLGKQVVSTDNACCKEVLQDGEYGFIAKKDAKDVALNILKAFAQPKDPPQLVRRAQDFELSKISGEYAKVLSANS